MSPLVLDFVKGSWLNWRSWMQLRDFEYSIIATCYRKLQNFGYDSINSYSCKIPVAEHRVDFEEKYFMIGKVMTYEFIVGG